MICKNCGTENTGDVCSNCGCSLQNQNNNKPTKKPIYKKWWFWLIAVISLLIVIIAASSGGGETGVSANTDKVNVDAPNVVENVAEYEINRVFVTSKIEALIEGYIYYEPEAGNEYVVIDANVKNLTSNYFEVEDAIKMNLNIDGVGYSGHGYIVTEEDIDPYGGIDPLESGRVYFAVEVPQGTSTDNMTLTVTCGEKVASCTVSVSDYEAKKEYISLGKEYTDNSTMNVKLEKVYFAPTVYPPKGNGHYEAENGKTYLVAKFKVKNLKGSALSDEDIAGVKCIYNEKYNYSGFVCTESEDGTDLDVYTNIDPLDTRYAYYLIEVPSEVEKGPAELEIYLLGNTYYYKAK